LFAKDGCTATLQPFLFYCPGNKGEKEAKGANATPEHKAEKKDAKSVDKNDKAAK
jgi:hypothetical protein